MDKPIHLAPHTMGHGAGKPRTAARRLHQLVSSPKAPAAWWQQQGVHGETLKMCPGYHLPARAWDGIAWRGLGMSGPQVLKQKVCDEMFPQVEHCPENAPWAPVLLWAMPGDRTSEFKPSRS